MSSASAGGWALSAAGGAVPPEFYARPAEQVARALLGTLLVSEIDGARTAGRIVETEAYVGPHDPASHAADRIGRTVRNASMFGPPGIAYVYRIYGIHWCLNAVTDRAGFPAAVLIRALEPAAGIEIMRARRAGAADRRSAARRAGAAGSTIPDRQLCSGPGRLAAALAIDGALDGASLQHGTLRIEHGAPIPDDDVVTAPRVGITRAADWPLRFFERGSRWVSRR